MQDNKTRTTMEVNDRPEVRRKYTPPTIVSAAIDRVVRSGGSVRSDSVRGTLSQG